MSDLFGPFYKAGRFLVRGYVICDREDFKPALGDLSLHLEGTFRSPLVISRVSGEAETGPRFSFDILTQSVLAQLLSSHDELEEKRFEIRAIDLGRVQHVVGRGGEDFLGRGSTSQLITSISGFGRFDGSGLRLELSGDLSECGFLGDATEPSLVRRTYRTAVEIPWEILRFLFHPLTVELWHKRSRGG